MENVKKIRTDNSVLLIPLGGVINTDNASAVAQAIAVIGIVASGATLIFGGEISGFLKSVIYLILVCSLLVAGNKIISVFSGDSGTTKSSGAEITLIQDINMTEYRG